MASMSYCRFENTSVDLQNCVSDLEDAYSFADLDHNKYEQMARVRLYELAQEYVANFERLEHAEEFEEEEFEEEEG